MMSLSDGHVTTIAVDPDVAPARRSARACCSRSRARRSRAARPRSRSRSRLSQQARAGAVPAVRLHAGRRAQGLLRRHRRGRAVMWAYEVDSARRTRRCSTGSNGASRARPCTSDRSPGDVRILGIETSCDETAAAVVDDGRIVRSSVVSSQADLHARFGGVVPEIASRAHVELIDDVIARGARRSRRRRSTTSTRSRRCTVPGSRARCSSA